VLKDPEKRKKYDALGQNWKQAGTGNFDQWFRSYARSPQGEGTFSFEDLFGGGGQEEFTDFFDLFMGGSRSGRQQQQWRTVSSKGKDYEATLNISLEEAIKGTVKEFSLNGKRIRVNLEPGTEEGKKLRLKNQGGEGIRGGQSGDLYLKIKFEKHDNFEKKGDDLFIKTSVDLYTAVLGGKKEITTIDGKTININIPSGSSSGKVLRIKGLGMPVPGSSRRGDLFIKIMVTVPQNLTEKEKELFVQLAELRKKE
jgi:curved DNA-binding protein